MRMRWSTLWFDVDMDTGIDFSITSESFHAKCSGQLFRSKRSDLGGAVVVHRDSAPPTVLVLLVEQALNRDFHLFRRERPAIEQRANAQSNIQRIALFMQRRYGPLYNQRPSIVKIAENACDRPRCFVLKQKPITEPLIANFLLIL